MSLHSHPYFEQFTETIIAGEHLLTPPLMVVAEILRDNRDQFNERTGEEESRVAYSQCKCVWYSNKSNQFEEAWISSKMLKLIKKGESEEEVKEHRFFTMETIDPYKLKYKKYFSVVLKTNELELGKRKSSMTLDENSIVENKEEKITINAYLAFVSPVMEIVQIMEAKDSEQKEVKFNSKTGEKRRISSNWVVKVKWFNAASDKFSEKILPISVLERLEPIDDKILSQIKEAIGTEKFFKYENIDKSITILMPKTLVYKNGTYHLKAFDYITNTHRNIVLISRPFDPITKYFSHSFPTYDFINTGISSDNSIQQELINGIRTASEGKFFIRIKYKNRNDKLSFRTLKDYVIKPVNDGRINYLEGKCQSCKETRTFNISEIQKLQILNLTFLSKP